MCAQCLCGACLFRGWVLGRDHEYSVTSDFRSSLAFSCSDRVLECGEAKKMHPGSIQGQHQRTKLLLAACVGSEKERHAFAVDRCGLEMTMSNAEDVECSSWAALFEGESTKGKVKPLAVSGGSVD